MTKQELINYVNERVFENTEGKITGTKMLESLRQIIDFLPAEDGQAGEDGVGIRSVDIQDVDVTPQLRGKKLTLTLTNNVSSSFTLTNGLDGGVGPQGPQGEPGPGLEDFDDFKDEFEQYKSDVSGRIATIKSEIENSTSQSIGNAMNQISQTQEDLSRLQQELGAAAQKAQDALDAARALSGLTISGISEETLQEILGMNQEVHDWMTEFSGKVATLMAEYNSLSGTVGELGIGLDSANGRIGIMGTNINTLSGTVGNVQTDWNASKGTIQNLATWYDESAGTYANLVRKMDGMNAYIEDMVAFYGASGGGTSLLTQYIDGKLAEFGRTIEFSGQDLTYIEERLNGISATVSTAITRYDGMSGELITINNRMDGLAGEVSTSLTKSTSALTEARDLRETWNAESGMIRTVTDLVIKRDGNGDPIYWYIDPELENPSDNTQWVRVYYQGEDANTGLPYYTTNKNGTGTRYNDHVFPDYLSGMLSYIKQNSGEIELNVTSGDIISLLRLEVTSGGSVIYMTADRVMIDADVIANSLIAKDANIGGVHIGNGMISAQTGNNKWALRGDGVLEATGANIKGAITATSGSFKGSVSADSGYFKGNIYADNGYFKGSVSADSGYFKGSVSATNGYFKGKVEANEGSFKGSVSATSGYFNNISANNITIQNSRFAGDITANSLTLGSQSIQDYISDQLPEDGLTKGEVNGLIASANNAYNWAVEEDLGDYLRLGFKYSAGTASSSVTISKQGLLVAKNAIISGTVYADRGVFNGDVYANNGRFNGDITATSLTLGTSSQNTVKNIVTANSVNSTYVNNALNGYATESWANGKFVTESDVNSMMGAAAAASGWTATDMGDYLELNNTYASGTSSVTISKQGLLQAKNAVIEGTIFATDGEFRGTVRAADIVLDGKSLKMFSGSSNGLEISNEPIVVDYIPQTVTISKTYQTFSSGNRGPLPAGWAYFTATGSTRITVPSITVYFNATNEDGGQISLVCSGASYVTSGSGMNNINPSGIVNRSYYTGLNANSSYGGNPTTAMGAVTIPETTFTTRDGAQYMVGYVIGCGEISSTDYTTHVEATSNSDVHILVPANPVQTTPFVRIGPNGIQVFLGKSFYFTAAYTGTSSNPAPVIAMAGLVNNEMKILKIDENGAATNITN